MQFRNISSEEFQKVTAGVEPRNCNQCLVRKAETEAMLLKFASREARLYKTTALYKARKRMNAQVHIYVYPDHSVAIGPGAYLPSPRWL